MLNQTAAGQAFSAQISSSFLRQMALSAAAATVKRRLYRYAMKKNSPICYTWDMHEFRVLQYNLLNMYIFQNDAIFP